MPVCNVDSPSEAQGGALAEIQAVVGPNSSELDWFTSI